MTIRRLSILTIVLAALSSVTCRDIPCAVGGWHCLSQDDRATINAWLLCDDDCDGERGAVKRIGFRAVLRLAGALEGPSGGRIEVMRRKFAASYAALPNRTISEAEYVNFFLENYKAVYQTRAAISLGDIGRTNDRAKDELRDALREDSLGNRSYRQDVLQAIRASLARATQDPFTGLLPSSAAFLDTVIVREDGGAEMNGDESVILNGGPFPDDLLLRSFVDSLAFLAVGFPGSYALSITGLGPDAVTQVGTFSITSLNYTPHPRYSAPELSGGPFPLVRFLALSGRAASTGGDTVEGEPLDFYKLEPDVAMSVTVTLQWTDTSEVVPLWQLCTDTSSMPATDIQGMVLDETGRPLAGVVVQPRGHISGVVTGAEGEFVFSGIPDPSILVTAAQPGRRSAGKTITVGTGGHQLSMLGAGPVTSPVSSTLEIPADSCRHLVIMKLTGGLRSEIVKAEIAQSSGEDVGSVSILPDAVSLEVGNSHPLAASVRDASGTLLLGRAVAWNSTEPSVVKVTQYGIIEGVSAGTAEVRAVSEGVAGSATVTVMEP